TYVAGACLFALAASAARADDILLQKGRAPKQKPGAAKAEKEAAAADKPRARRDHFSKWTAPAAEELPAEAKIHIIKKGDTLWDLARTYLGDPYLWPQI